MTSHSEEKTPALAKGEINPSHSEFQTSLYKLHTNTDCKEAAWLRQNKGKTGKYPQMQTCFFDALLGVFAPWSLPIYGLSQCFRETVGGRFFVLYI